MKKRKIDQTKFELAEKIFKSVSPDLLELFRDCEIVGLNERVTYHKMQENEEVPYTHVFENETILLKHKKYPLLLIFGPKIKYKNNFIEN